MNKRAQSVIEYACFLAVFIAAIVLMSAYIKRGIQGNWHTNTASLYPELYEPNVTAEINPLQIQVSNYSFQMQEQGGAVYTKKGASWVGDGKAWQIWSE